MSSSSFLFLIQLCVIMLCSCSMEARRSHDISLGSTLSSFGPQTSWLSPSGDFAFGFHPVVDNGSATRRRFLLAIWFDKTDPKTVVWSAEPERSVTGEATLELKTDGRLVLTDAQNRVLWNTTGVSDDVSHAAMLDDGNFVLAGPDGSLRWQSFEHPTDTLLPGQSLLPGNKLQSMDTGKSDKRFELLLDINGSNLSLYAITLQSDTSYGFYWSVNTSNIATQLCFQQSRLVLVLMNESVINITSPSTETETDKVYQRATLGDDGVFRHYVHPKNKATMGWKTVAFVPEEICQSVFTYGSGICGFNSYCKRDNENVECKCPPQFSYFDHNRTFGGCKQDFSSQSCNVDESSMFELQAMVNVDWPLSAYDHFQPMQEEECKEVCLTDCLCAAVIFWNSTGDCWKKRHPMSNGRSGGFVDRTAYIKIPKGEEEGEGEGEGGSSLAVVATSWGYVMPQIVVPNAKK